MLKAIKDVNVLYDGKSISLKKGDILDVGKEFGFIGRDAKGAEVFLRDKYGLVEVVEEIQKALKEEIIEEPKEEKKEEPKEEKKKPRSRKSKVKEDE